MIGIQHDEQEHNHKNITRQYKNSPITWLYTTIALLNAQELRMWMKKFCTILNNTCYIVLNKSITDIVGCYIVSIIQHVNRNDTILHFIIFLYVAYKNKEYQILGLIMFLVLCWWKTFAQVLTKIGSLKNKRISYHPITMGFRNRVFCIQALIQATHLVCWIRHMAWFGVQRL